MDAKTVREKHKQFLFPSVTNYYQEPLVAERGEGVWLWDAEGKKYLDFFGGILTVSLGHCHPEITARIAEQLKTLQHSSTLYPNARIVEMAERLAQITPGDLSKSYFTNSGTEADETAIILAKIHTGSQEVIALRHAYSGRSMLAGTITAHSPWRPLPAQIAGVVHAVSPYCYRCPFGLTYPSCNIKCAQDLEELIMTTTCGRPAAFIAEPIQGVGGFITPPKEYFQVAVGIVRKHGGLFICDEVQTGFGRTGGKMFGIEHFGVEPDIMTFAKGLANGTPIGATITRPEIADSFKALQISTFGGNPVSMTAALATLDIIQREAVPARSEVLGKRLRDHLLGLQEKYPLIGDIRGLGLMVGVELVKDRQTKEPAAKEAGQIMEAAKQQGLLIGKGGLYGNVLRIAPPMLVSEREIDDAALRLDRALGSVIV